MIDHYFNARELYDKTVMSVCERCGLTYMEFTVIMFLVNNPEYDTATEIVKYRHLTKSHVSISVRSLEEKGLLIGEYRNDNRRTVHLVPTNRASGIIKLGKEAQKEFTDYITEGFTDAEKEKIVDFIKRIDTNIENNLNKENK